MDKSLFKRAVEDTPDATPGYMFRDIANWTFVDQNTQTKLVNALFDKLDPKTSVHVLAKVLRIIKIVCETGHADFQKEMQRRSDQIKDYAAYRGAPHPQFGDRLNEKVRIAAKDAIDAAFTARKENKIQVEAGHGSSADSSGNKGSSSSGGAVGGLFAGFTSTFTTGHNISASQAGDARIASMPTSNKWAEHMAKGGQEESAAAIAVGNAFEKAKLGFGLFGNEAIKSKEDRIRESQSDVGEFKAVDIAFIGGSRGPFGPTAAASAAPAAASSAAGGWKFADEAEAGLPPVEQHTTLGRFLTPFQKEVERIAIMKNAPQRVDLTQFLATVKEINEVQGMSYEDLAQTLDEHIAQKHPWQARLNVMTLIESLVRAELSPEIGNYFNENPEDIQRNVHVVQSSLKEKSQKVLKMLGIPERNTASAKVAPAAAAAAPSTAAADIDFEGMTVTRKARRTKATADEGGAATSVERATPAPEQQQAPVASSAAFGDDFADASPKAAPAAAAAASDPTKLRRRAQMNTDDFMNEVAPSAPSKPATSSSWGDSAGNAGWGSTTAGSSSTAGGWGSSDANAGGWGAGATNAGGWGAPAATAAPAPAPVAAPVAAPVVSAKAAMDFDDFFGGTSSSTSAPAPVAPVVAAPAPVVSSPVAAAPAGPTPAQVAANNQMAMVLQMQQQVQQMLSGINMSDPSALQQMQMLMQQQQQLMTMMQQAQAAQQAANAAAATSATNGDSISSANASVSNLMNPASPPQPHGHFNAPPLVKDHSKERAFEDVKNEMIKQMFQK